MKKNVLFFYLMCLSIFSGKAQLPDSCKLYFGTNLGGLSDYGAEQPFVDLMKSCREWYTKDVDNPDYPFNSGNAAALTYLPNGYPTHAPQSIAGSTYLQRPATVWGSTDGWEAGSYVVLFDGEGTLSFWGGISSLEHPSSNKYTFDLLSPLGNIIEMVIVSSAASNPIQNIRIINADYESSYMTQPFNPKWLDKLSVFPSVRFMDWGRTNNWSQIETWSWDNPTLRDWNERAPYDYYTWTTNKGIPYEMMVRLMNDYDLDGWLCVPHNSSDDYQTKMAQFFLEHLEPERNIIVEYSNEIWNWMFGQAQWLNQYGCIDMGVTWPEGTVPYIQKCMDNWTAIWGAGNSRLTRAVGVQTGWLDVAQRTAFNMTPGSFDAIAATYYFGINDSADAILDEMGSAVTVENVVGMVRSSWYEGKAAILNIKEALADSLGIPITFYEGGQHITPIPFGDEPTYASALIDVQRDTAMYNLYQEWYDFIRTLQEGDKPLTLMNFSLIATRSARYGSWGIWETMFQDTNVVPAPKFQATMDNIYAGCWTEPSSVKDLDATSTTIMVYPNPASSVLHIHSENTVQAQVIDALGREISNLTIQKGTNQIACNHWPNGIYYLRINNSGSVKFVIQR